MHVDLADGRRLTKRVDYPLGHAKNPLKDSQVEEKFYAYWLNRSLGSERARKIIDIVWKLDEAKNVDELMKATEMPHAQREKVRDSSTSLGMTKDRST